MNSFSRTFLQCWQALVSYKNVLKRHIFSSFQKWCKIMEIWMLKGVIQDVIKAKSMFLIDHLLDGFWNAHVFWGAGAEGAGFCGFCLFSYKFRKFNVQISLLIFYRRYCFPHIPFGPSGYICIFYEPIPPKLKFSLRTWHKTERVRYQVDSNIRKILRL